VSTSIGSATVSFEPPADTGDAPITAFVVTAIDESTGESTGAVGSSSPITVSPGGGTFKFRAQAVNGFGAGRLTEFLTGQAVLSGAELYAWGNNGSGRLGDGTTANKSSPVQIGALTNWAQVSTGYSHTVALTTNGELYAWGNNSSYRLGDGTTANKSSPVQIGALTNWAQVSTGIFGGHSLAIKTDNTLWAWGVGSNGQRGDGIVANVPSPVQIGALTNWAQVTAGSNFSASVTTSGELYAWGDNSYGRLGDNTVVSKSSPVQIGALTNWAQVSAGSNHCAAVKTDGTLWSWGRNQFGQLGQNTLDIHRSSPVQVGALTNWSHIDSGYGHCIAVKTDGTLWSWGGGGNGQLGDNTVVSKSSPVQIGALTNWAQVSAGDNFSVAITTGGQLYAWGYGGNGRLGDGTVVNRSSPVQVGALTDWIQVSAGNQQALATLGVL
jgi:alpha-tubulin suppressor-like RCC1 family protein